MEYDGATGETPGRADLGRARPDFALAPSAFAAQSHWRNGYVLQDAAGVIHAAGPGTDGSLFGWAPDELVSVNAPQMVHPDDREVAAQVRGLVRSGGGTHFVQLRLRSRAGRWIWSEVEFRPHTPADARWGPMTVALLRDVSAAHLEYDVLGLLTEMRSLIASTTSLPDGWRALLERFVAIGGFTGGVVWEVDDAGPRIRHGWSPHIDSVRLAAAIGAGGLDTMEPAETWVSGSARWVATGTATSSVLRRSGGTETSTSLMIPVAWSHSDLVAIVELVSARGECWNEDLVVAVVQQLGDTIQQKHVETRLAAAEREFRTAFTNAPVGVAMYRPDGTFEHVNEALCRFLDRTEAELVGLAVRDVIHPESSDADDTAFAEIVDGRRSSYETETRCLRADGGMVWASVSVSAVRSDDGVLVRFITQVHDIDARKRAEHEARLYRARLRATFDDLGIAMALIRADGDQPGRLLEVNRAFARLTGIEARALGNHRILDVLAPEHAASFALELDELAGPDPDTFQGEMRIAGPTGSAERWVRVVAAPVNDESLHGMYVGVHLEDVTEQRRARHDLARIGLHDALTDLPNRSLILDRIRNAQTRSERSGRHIGLLCLDLDKFKDVNDSLGHHAGDLLIVEIADRLRSTIRPSDTASRLGGDEFVILCDELSTDPLEARSELESVATRIHQALEAPFRLGDVDAYCTASIGMDVLSGTAVPVETALGNVDVAMYRAKARGRARTETYNAAARHDAVDRLRMASELRLAIERNQMHVAYQPIVEVHRGGVVGAEALLRWTHPELGVVSPAQFIDVAEGSDLIVTLGDFVLDQACRDLRRLHADDDFYVSVNVSARQLSRSSFVDMYREGLAHHGLDSSRLAVELTENVLMDAGGSSLKQLGELRDLGASVGVDDFGTGYASLTYLKQLPIDFVKVDRSFIGGLPDDRDDCTITDAVISLARALDLRVIAEGVETRAQADVLDSLNCGYAQGYLYGRPVAAAAGPTGSV